MDRRERKYYLVTFNYDSYDMRMEYTKICCPSRKVHPVKQCWIDIYKDYWQMLMSCKNEHSESLEYELRKAIRNDKGVTAFIEI